MWLKLTSSKVFLWSLSLNGIVSFEKSCFPYLWRNISGCSYPYTLLPLTLRIHLLLIDLLKERSNVSPRPFEHFSAVLWFVTRRDVFSVLIHLQNRTLTFTGKAVGLEKIIRERFGAEWKKASLLVSSKLTLNTALAVPSKNQKGNVKTEAHVRQPWIGWGKSRCLNLRTSAADYYHQRFTVTSAWGCKWHNQKNGSISYGSWVQIPVHNNRRCC